MVILGARQVGKTTLARALGKDWTYVDLERPDDLDRLSYDLTFFFSEHPASLILDEAQEYPEVFKILRGVIDADRKKNGRFILTGSSSPALITEIRGSCATGMQRQNRCQSGIDFDRKIKIAFLFSLTKTSPGWTCSEVP